MHILRIEHPVPNFDTWKTAFDSDPIGRKQSGMHRYRILRPTMPTTSWSTWSSTVKVRPTVCPLVFPGT
jgi:hypothetical protein